MFKESHTDTQSKWWEIFLGRSIPLRELWDNIKGQTKLCQRGDSPMDHKRWLRKEIGREPDLVAAHCLLSFTHYKWESSSAAPNLFMIDCSLELFTTKEVWTFGENPSSRHPHTHPHLNTKGSFPPQEMKFEMTSGHTSTAAPLLQLMYTQRHTRSFSERELYC